MKEITYTLISDGSSDKRLLPILTWLLRQCCPNLPIQSEWFDFYRVRRPPKTLTEKIRMSLELYPCDMLFIHRDAENQSFESRKNEIIFAIREVEQTVPELPAICVVPVRMQEAWLLFDEIAIRKAASNPNGRCQIQLPDQNESKTLPNPKILLYDLMRRASELTGRRLRNLNLHKRAHLVAEYINDYSPLRNLTAFRHLEQDLVNLVTSKNWTIN